MGSRTVNNVITPNTIALNAYIYGYGGHSLVTPHAVIKQVWWTEERIHAKVTPDFVASRLRPEQRDHLRRPVGFGDGLTDDTYLDWILERARRFFLILAEIGVPDQIFGIIDDSWDDDDLPIARDDVDRLALAYEKDPALNQRFYSTQFTFLLRIPREGSHLSYGPNEIIPLEHVYKLPPAVSLQHWTRFHLPQNPDFILVRRQCPLSRSRSKDATPDPNRLRQFLADVETSRLVPHDHIAPVWASYVSKATAYFLTTFVGHHTLRSFIDHRNPPQYAKLPNPERRTLLVGWCHCLAHAVAALHAAGLCHGAIRPSTILIDEDNQVAFADAGAALPSFQHDRKPIDQAAEAYTYAPPEAHGSALTHFLAREWEGGSGGGGSNSNRTTSISTGSTESAGSRCSCSSAPAGDGLTRIHMATTDGASRSERCSDTDSQRAPRRRARKLSRASAISSSSSSSTLATHGFDFGFGRPRTRTPRPESRSSHAETASTTAAAALGSEAADVFALGCMFLELLTFLRGKKAGEFARARRRRPQKKGGRVGIGVGVGVGVGPADASFHANLGAVREWIAGLEEGVRRERERERERLERGKEGGDGASGGVLEMLGLVRSMLAVDPQMRPRAAEVEELVRRVLVEECGVMRPHCGGRVLAAAPAATAAAAAAATTMMGAVDGEMHARTVDRPVEVRLSMLRLGTGAGVEDTGEEQSWMVMEEDEDEDEEGFAAEGEGKEEDEEEQALHRDVGRSQPPLLPPPPPPRSPPPPPPPQLPPQSSRRKAFARLSPLSRTWKGVAGEGEEMDAGVNMDVSPQSPTRHQQQGRGWTWLPRSSTRRSSITSTSSTTSSTTSSSSSSSSSDSNSHRSDVEKHVESGLADATDGDPSASATGGSDAVGVGAGAGGMKAHGLRAFPFGLHWMGGGGRR